LAKKNKKDKPLPVKMKRAAVWETKFLVFREDYIKNKDILVKVGEFGKDEYDKAVKACEQSVKGGLGDESYGFYIIEARYCHFERKYVGA